MPTVDVYNERAYNAYLSISYFVTLVPRQVLRAIRIVSESRYFFEI